MFFDGGSLGDCSPIQYLHPPPFTLTGGKGGAHVPRARTERTFFFSLRGKKKFGPFTASSSRSPRKRKLREKNAHTCPRPPRGTLPDRTTVRSLSRQPRNCFSLPL